MCCDRGDQPGLRLERRHPVGQQLAGLRSPAQVWRRGSENERFLTPLAAGSKLGCFALTEPGGRERCRGPAGDRPAGRRRLRAQRHQGVHHQRFRRRPRAGLRVGRPRGQAQEASPPSSSRAIARATSDRIARVQAGGQRLGDDRALLRGHAGCRPINGWERRARASRSPWPRSTEAASVSRPRQSVSLRGLSKKALPTAQERQQFGRADRRLSGDPVLPRRHVDRDRRRTTA